jgi:hypothetical protein
MMAMRDLNNYTTGYNAVEKPLEFIDPFSDLLLNRWGRIQVVKSYSKRFLHADPPIDCHQALWPVGGPDALT